MKKTSDLKLPDGYEMPSLPLLNRWQKRFQRAAIEISGLFNRTARRERMTEFNQRWAQVEAEVLARGLGYYDLFNRVDPITAFRARTLRFLPKDLKARRRIYRLNAELHDSVRAYRKKLGLPPGDKPPGPWPL